MRIFTPCFLILSCILFSIACKKDDSNCKEDEPTLSFTIVNGTVQSFFNPEIGKSVKISYSTPEGLKTYLNDLEVAGNPKNEKEWICKSSEIIQIADKSNLTKFTIEIDEKDYGDFQVKTATETNKCGNGVRVSEILFKGDVQQPVDGVYTLTISN